MKRLLVQWTAALSLFALAAGTAAAPLAGRVGFNVNCNVHPNMSAVIHVLNTPYYTLADTNGSFNFDVPAGRYDVVAWNEMGGTSRTPVDVTTAGSPSVALMLDARGFKATQHANK